jgi:hypothetical protein
MNNPNTYFITYSNHFEYDGNLYAFRKKELFCITNTPVHIPFNKVAKCWIINRKQVYQSTIQKLIINKPIKVDVTSLNWNVQCELDEVFNL